MVTLLNIVGSKSLFSPTTSSHSHSIIYWNMWVEADFVCKYLTRPSSFWVRCMWSTNKTLEMFCAFFYVFITPIKIITSPPEMLAEFSAWLVSFMISLTRVNTKSEIHVQEWSHTYQINKYKIKLGSSAVLQRYPVHTPVHTLTFRFTTY